METKITTYRDYHEISHTMRFPFNESINLEKVKYASPNAILKSKDIREYFISALQARIGACTSQLFKNYNNVIHVSEYQIEFVIKSENKIHPYNIPSVNVMNKMIKWLETGNCNVDSAPCGGWEQLGKALYWVEKEKWTVIIEGISVKVSFEDLISMIFILHNTQIPVSL